MSNLYHFVLFILLKLYCAIKNLQERPVMHLVASPRMFFFGDCYVGYVAHTTPFHQLFFALQVLNLTDNILLILNAVQASTVVEVQVYIHR